MDTVRCAVKGAEVQVKNNWCTAWLCVFWKPTCLHRSLIVKSQQNIIEIVTRPGCHQTLHKNENQRAKIIPETESFVCPTCNKGFANKQYLKYHMKIHERKEKAYKCDICTASFKTKNGLKFHIKSAHTSQEKRDYCCPVCNANFISGKALKRHLTQAHNYTHKKYAKYTKVWPITKFFSVCFL